MGLFSAPFPLPDSPRALLQEPLPAPTPRTAPCGCSGSPTNDTRGHGDTPLSPPCAGSGKSFGLFYFCSSPQALSPRRPGQPRQHRHAGCPGGFSHSCGRRRHGNELIAGEWRPPEPPPARPGPARWVPGLRDSLPLKAFGENRADPSPAAQSPGAGTVTQLTLGTPRGCGCRSGEPWRPLRPLCSRTPTGSIQCSPHQVMSAGKSKVVRQTNKPGKLGEVGKKKIKIFLPTRGEKAQRSTGIHQPLPTAADRASDSTWISFSGNFSDQVGVFSTSLEWALANERPPQQWQV